MRRLELNGLLLLLASGALMACGGNGGNPDGGGTIDGGGVDSTTPDGGGTDSATPDGGGVDGSTDGGGVDGSTDGGGVDGSADGGGVDGSTDGGGVDGSTDGGGVDGSTDSGTDGGTAFAGTLPPAHTAAAGLTFSAVIDDAGALWTFGAAATGSLGNGQTPSTGAHHGNAYVPTRPSVIDGFTITHVAAGGTHMVALQSTGDVWTWGTNDSGQLGDGTTTRSMTPLHIDVGSAAIDIAAGANHTLALDSAGAVWAWGSNGGGRLGDGTTTQSDVPIAADASALPAGVVFAAISAGTNHSVGLADDGTVWAWGSGRFPLGFGGLGEARAPAQVVGEGEVGTLGHIVAIASGGSHVLALADDGTLWAWGDNSAGQLGDGSGVPWDSPVRVDTSGLPSSISGIRAGENQSFALLSDGTLWGWGENNMEQLGLPTGDVATPTQIVITGGVRDVAGARNHGVAIGAAGGFWSWGQNQDGVQGTGLTTASPTPVPTYGPAGLTPTAVWPAREDYSFIQMSDGSVWGVGRGFSQSGNILGGASPVLVVPVGGINVAQMAGGQNHTLVLDTAGTVWAFGSNDSGQLGNGTTTASTSAVPVDLSGLPAGVTITKVAVDTSFSAAVASDGSVWTWGGGINGELGDGTTTRRAMTPVQVRNSNDTAFLTGIVDIAVGGDHIVVLDSAGAASTWGVAANGALGATPLNSCGPSGRACNRLPQRVCNLGTDFNTCTGLGEFLGAVDEIAAGDDHTLLRQGGQVLAMGARNQGQLGDGTFSTGTRASVPIRVVNTTDTSPLTGIARIAAANQSSYAVATDGTVYAWGENGSGEVALDPATTICSTRRCRPRPSVVSALAGVTVTQLSAGNHHVLALDDADTIWSWGSTSRGQLGRIEWISGLSGGRISFEVAPIVLLPR